MLKPSGHITSALENTSDLAHLEKRLTVLEHELEFTRNQKRELQLHLAWDRSWTKIVLLTVVTYIVIAFVFYCIGSKKYFVNAIIPSVAYFISTRSLSFVKKIWLQKHKNNFRH